MDRRDLLALGILLALVIVFFLHLFIPQPKVFYTPDFGRSDLWNYNYPMREFLSQSLRRFELPLWNKDVGTGFPYFAEGQTDSFLFYHPILYFLLPTWLAFNLSFIAALATAAIGMYLLGRLLGFSRTTALLASLPFTFSGYLVTRISQNTIFPASLFPLFVYATLRIMKKPNLTSLLIFSAVFSQLIFAGHLQFPFMAVIGVGMMCACLVIFKHANGWREAGEPKRRGPGLLAGGMALGLASDRTRLRKFSIIVLGCFFGAAIAAIQILPFLEFWTISTRKQTFSLERATQLSLKPSQLITIAFPYSLGTPKDASYPTSTEDIFWEKTAYVGFLPLVFVFLHLLKGKKDRATWAFYLFLALSLLLAMGRNSPLAFLFTFPPFSFLRGPARFLVFSALSLSLLFGFATHALEKKLRRTKAANPIWYGLIAILATLVIADLWWFGLNYHPTVPVEDALQAPEAARFFALYPGRIFHLGSEAPYLAYFLKHGWQDTEFYLYMKNALAANSHLLFNLSNVDAAYALASERYKLMDDTLKYQATGNLATLTATSNELHKRLLSLSSIRFLVSPFFFYDPDLRRVYTVKPPLTKEGKKGEVSWPFIYVYENINALPRFRFVSSYAVRQNLDDVLALIGSKDFAYKDSTVLEENPHRNLQKGEKQSIKLLADENQYLQLSVATDQATILEIADSFYPGWKAYVDDKEVKIYPANINQRALIVPAGNHQIEMKFQPLSVYLGGVVSGISIFLWFILFLRSCRRIF